MEYDPIKRIIGNTVRDSVPLRKLFYRVLGIVFLREWHVKRELRRLLSGNSIAMVFDAGSGFGQYSYYCATRFPGISIHAVDVKEEQIKDCERFFRKANIQNVKFAIEDLNQPVHTNEFDLALSVDVMEHIPDDVRVFRNLFGSLKNGGTLLVNTPSILGGSDAHSPDDKSFIGEHARNGYGVEEIRQKLESVGFKVARIKFTYGPWGSVAWRLGTKYPMLLLNVSKAFFILLPFYFLLVMPFVLPLMYIDYASENRTGTGLIVVAQKPE
ncbi:MAG: methyltransferase domain-containing protein [Bacteroidota bacterium]